jgi:hypothetical protein
MNEQNEKSITLITVLLIIFQSWAQSQQVG